MTGRRPVRTTLLALGLAVCSLWVWAGGASAELAPDRRRDQYPEQVGYLFVPAPYSLPGIGEGIAYVAYLTNVIGSHGDAYFYGITGDAQGFGAGLSEVYLYPRTLLLEMATEQIDRAQVFQYPSRGMATSKNDYQLVDLSHDESSVTLILSLDERRFELFSTYESEEARIRAFRERGGDLIQKLDDPVHEKGHSWTVGFRVDFTDDYTDPRSGVRAIVDGEHFPRSNNADPDYYRINTQLDFFLPIGRQSTLAVDLFRSGATVNHQGETDPAVIVRDVCPVPDPLCEGSPQARDYVANAIAANANGSSDALGGQNRLQGYPRERFKGAYTMYAGAEFRWNLTEEVTPFDYFIWKDVRTNFQIALIAETGTVAETEGALWDRSRSDYGAGLRMVMASGGVYRADYVTGDEGPQITVIVSYPW